MKHLFLIILFIPVIGFCQQPIEKIDSIISSKFNNGPAISTLITKDYKPLYQIIKGKSNIELQTKANTSTKFRIGSITKQFTAVAILKLMEEGKLRLDDTIQKHLPNFPAKKQPITIEHLLTHTSGLAEITELDVFYNQLMKNGCEPDSLVKYFKDLPLNFTPGKQFSYSNSGYHLLGLIIEKVSGIDYNEYIAKNLLTVAKMDNTLPDTESSIIFNRAQGYEELFGKLKNASYIDMSIPFSGGNLLSTTEDINKWYKTLFEYKILTKSTLKMAHSPYKLNDETYSNYGYGWFVDSLQGELLISHEGGINGFLSSVWYIPSSKTLTVLLSNCSCNPTVNTTKHLTAIAIGKPFPETKRIKLPLELLKTYEGTYNMDGEEWTISIKAEELYFQFPNGNGHSIYPRSKHEFFAEEWDSKFFFYQKDGQVEFQFVYLKEIIKGSKIKL